MKVATALEMREIDSRTIKHCKVPAKTLMERAGFSVALRIKQLFAPQKVVVLAGAGNNGGDGVAAARILHESGWDVNILLFEEQKKLSPECLLQCKLAKKKGVSIEHISKLKEKHIADSLVVDSFFGTGLQREITGSIADAIALLNSKNIPVIAVDIPSGISADTGQIMGEAVKADYTVTFGLPKRGHFLYPGAKYSGKLFVQEIGFPAELLKSENISTELLEKREMSLLLPERPEYSHKGYYGHVLIVAGSREKTGAAFMCAKSCLMTGAGIVTIGIPETLVSAFQPRVTEEMILALPDRGDGTLSADASEKILNFLSEKADVLAIGPGLTVTNDTTALIFKIAGAATVPMVMDADAINALGKHPDIVSLLCNAKSPIIFTPHTGEMARLLKASRNTRNEIETRREIEKDRVNSAINFSKLSSAYVVLKGAPTIVAAPEGNAFINTTGNPGMAKAGSGDVLTGMISAFLSQNLSPVDASSLGVFMHGLSGDIVLRKKGAYSILASDIIDSIPGAFLSLRQ
ncbi:MAG: NAD(P)H-hydrate dehydratase [Nitrospiraceae bacterium]|nr:NAD(P)H-hydrate dehydratase [Nitrospiraceae bacterium]